MLEASGFDSVARNVEGRKVDLAAFPALVAKCVMEALREAGDKTATAKVVSRDKLEVTTTLAMDRRRPAVRAAASKALQMATNPTKSGGVSNAQPV